jgi:hypothetical protein
MSKGEVLCKFCALIIVVIITLGRPQIIDAVPPEGHDFTKVPAGASYKPNELLVRFAPKHTGIQRNTVERNQILTSLGEAAIKRSSKIVPILSLPEVMSLLTIFR